MDDIFEAMEVLGELRKEVLLEYPDVEVSDPTGLGGSVGRALWPSDHDRGIEIMVREAWLLNIVAHTGLATIHRMSAGDAVEPDARIIAYFKESAEEGLSISMYEYGQFLLFGLGVEEDVERGTELLKKSGRPKAWMSLYNHAYYLLKDEALSKEYLLEAAEYDLPDATYELGIFAQEEGDYEEAISFFERTLRLDSRHQPARLELARMYVEGWGVEAHPVKGFELMQAVEQGPEGEVATQAKANLGMFYLRGIGVEKDEVRGVELLKQALAEGSLYAARVLEDQTSIETELVE